MRNGHAMNGSVNGNHYGDTLWSRVVPEQLSQAVHSFRFRSGQTPFGRFQDAVACCLVYFMLVRVLKAMFKNRKALDLRPVIVVHNFFLTVVSTALFAGFVMVMLEKVQQYNAWELICSEAMHNDGRLHALYYLNYLVKWYELLDTMFLIVRKKEVIFLHEYHHAATLWLCWIQMDQHSTVQWVPIIINLFVHMFMYYYYMLSALHIKVWWKKYLTQIQIVQFVIDIGVCCYCATQGPFLEMVRAWDWFTIVTEISPKYCHGTLAGSMSGIGIIFSYLILFLVFYANTYKSGKAVKVKGSNRKSD